MLLTLGRGRENEARALGPGSPSTPGRMSRLPSSSAVPPPPPSPIQSPHFLVSAFSYSALFHIFPQCPAFLRIIAIVLNNLSRRANVEFRIYRCLSAQLYCLTFPAVFRIIISPYFSSPRPFNPAMKNNNIWGQGGYSFETYLCDGISHLPFCHLFMHLFHAFIQQN